MRTQKPRYSKDEFTRRSDRVYEQAIQPHLTPEDEGKLVVVHLGIFAPTETMAYNSNCTSTGKFVLMDIETGAYEIDEDELAASARLLARFPTAQVWMAQVGLRAARIHPLSKQRKTPRRLGTAKGKVIVPPEFFEPLPEEILRAFEGRDA